jgi:hypothetical protein
MGEISFFNLFSCEIGVKLETVSKEGFSLAANKQIVCSIYVVDPCQFSG